MKRFFETIKHIFTIEELRTRIVNTILFLIIFRLGTFIALPGIDPDKLKEADGIFGFLDNLLGGAWSNASIFALGIMPYISASIVIQLLTVAVPYFQKLQKEGESGRKKMTQITRILTILITIGQSVGYITGTISDDAIMIEKTQFIIYSVVILTSGTIFCMWLGEKITDKGIGNGISMLIMVGIISRLPAAIIGEAGTKGAFGIFPFMIELGVLFVIIMGTVMLTQAVRRVPVQYAKQLVGNAPAVGERQFIPLKVNASGVMPIIFAQAIMYLPAMVGTYWQSKSADSDIAAYIGTTFSNPTSWQYSLLLAVLIIVFTFFYTAISINPNQIAEDMKRNGGFVPGVKPGAYTAEYIDTILTRITLPGAIALAIVAIIPAFAALAGVGPEFAQFFGGTSLLIMVGVVLDTLQQVESYLLMRHYDGLMKTGKVRSRMQGTGASI